MPRTHEEQAARLDRLIGLLDGCVAPPPDVAAKQTLLRALMNLHSGEGLPAEFFALQDEELAAQKRSRGVVEVSQVAPSPKFPHLRLWRGDITRLAADAIVNAANRQLLGCFHPLHNCIDNIIHSRAGLQLRAECRKLMQAQGHEEPVGSAKITPAYNLPARWVIHTVGPIVEGDAPTPRQCRELAACYAACLDLARHHGLESLAFCCISTGVFHFPNALAARIAVETVLEALGTAPFATVIFDVFTDKDEQLYRKLLGY
ncbi:MAG: protein-ADP-ribose hydrolase [Desulfovibrio sp.]|nr:protein-ADP-ribose hydrolase [Desulfovibrio sp.]